MITPSPTTKISPELARGVLAAVVEATATRPGYITITIPDSSYELHLRPTAAITTPIGKRIVGRIEGQARRVDTVETGGRYIEPVAGRPRRIQGHIIAVDAGSNTITINAGAPVHLKLGDARQPASTFEVGQFVTSEVLDGATFTPAG